MSEALLIAGHGSRDASGVNEFWALAEAWQRLRPDRLQAAGFLEFARPTIGEAIDDLVGRGARRITVVPAMLMAAGHVKNDIPSEIHEGQDRQPGVTFAMARALDIHPALLELCQVRYREATANLVPIAPARTMLLLVGRGTSDPDANANIARVARFLWEALGLGWASIAYSGLAEPGVDEALIVCRRMGFERIVVQPYLLLDGVLVKRIHETVARHATQEKAAEIVATAHLGVHPLVLRGFEDRAHEANHGEPHMNCGLCKYRVRLTGREGEVGLPQVGHHHHVRASGEEHDDHDHVLRSRRLRQAPRAEEADGLVHAWDERLLRRLSVIN
jgi:sirohydrochlorin ferrochelatase